MSYTKNQIALLSKEELENTVGLTVPKLREIYRDVLGLKGGSGKNKKWLVEHIYEATNVLRAAIIASNERLAEENKLDEALQQAKQKEKENSLKRANQDGNFYVDGQTLYNQFKNKETKYFNYPPATEVSSWVFANYLAVGYSPNYILADKTTEFKLALKELSMMIITDLWDKQKVNNYIQEIKQYWYNLIRPYRDAKNALDAARLASKHKTPNDSIENNTIAVIDWAINRIKTPPESKQEEVHQGYAFSILTGRRLMEVFGTESKYELNGNFIKFSESLKGSLDTAFVPLADSKLLVDFINNYSKKTYELSQDKTASSYVGKRKPPELLKLNIKTFKDCRDFYASVLKRSFDNIGGRGEVFTQISMGHKNSDSTAYYAHFKIEPVTRLNDVLTEYMEFNETNAIEKAKDSKLLLMGGVKRN